MFIIGHQRFASSQRPRSRCSRDVPGHFRVNVLEHAPDIVLALLREDAELFRFLLRCADVASDSSISAACRSSSHSPMVIRCAFSRSIGSPSGHALASSLGR